MLNEGLDPTRVQPGGNYRWPDDDSQNFCTAYEGTF